MAFDPWTFALQAANFLILVWLLNRFLYRPVQRVIADRRKAAAEATARAAAAQSQAEALRRDLEAQRAAIAKERDGIVAAAQKQGEAERKVIMEKASQDAARLSAEAQAALARERDAATEALGHDAVRLANAIARRVLGEHRDPAAQTAMLDEICGEIGALAPEAKRGIAERASGQPHPCTVITAEPLDPAAAKAVEKRLCDALGAPAKCEFKVDPALIVGAEVRFPFTRVRRAWADDLERIEQQLLRHAPAPSIA